MVANRDIKAGEIILEEQPLTFGPVCSTGGEEILPLCLGCYRPVGGSFLCSECGWPMCCQACCNMQQHKDWECSVFKEKGFFVDATQFNYDKNEPSYGCISPLRALLLQEKNPERSGNFIKFCWTYSYTDILDG
jgi:hypothetical protein